MKKLELFRMIGENYAKISYQTIQAPIATSYFTLLADEMYPLNPHRHEWAVSNMIMFYTKECERNTIMRMLQQSNEESALEMIRRRNS